MKKKPFKEASVARGKSRSSPTLWATLIVSTLLAGCSTQEPPKPATIQSAKIKIPSNKGRQVWMQSISAGPLEGDGEEFFLDILFYRMSETSSDKCVN